jgi:hypothetical protein
MTDPRLGRLVRHDPRSRAYPFTATEAPRRDIQLRGYGPHPVPNQTIGCCTGVDAAVKCNVVGNRVKGVILDMDDAVRIYTRATHLDDGPGAYPPDDTGSSGLAAAQASKEFGLITRYEWIFTGTAGIYAALTAGHPVGVGTRWDTRMFDPDPTTGLVEPGGDVAGGHQWTVTGYRRKLDAFVGQCWWGAWGLGDAGRFLIRRGDLEQLLADQGDAHITYRAAP